ncbi:MAG TPA: alpha-amylase family glycosyl hydrolase, partial [Longimicrobiales bacterium]|nr:alpha-amylase family glycosyl hydrolase [Longimicrobiales bacterium]
MKALTERTLPIGAEPIGRGGVDFRVWAPDRQGIEVVLEHGPGAGTTVVLEAEADGYFSGLVDAARPGTRYRYRLDSTIMVPDPASRFQPEGPHGASEVIEAATFPWTDHAWPGPDLDRPVIYELHIGTFTREGTWHAAQERLEHLADLGVSVIEVMPVGEFPGRFGWGYDSVYWFAPTRLYGRPDDFRCFVDRAHTLGLGVILDVVYNHLGPVGCYLREFSATYFSRTRRTEWGAAINFDGPGCQGARELVLSNAEYWTREFHLDGLRLDATQSIFDASS